MNVKMFDYATIKILLKTKHPSLKSFAEECGMLPKDYAEELIKRLGEKRAKPLLREMKKGKGEISSKIESEEEKVQNDETDILKDIEFKNDSELKTDTKFPIETEIETQIESQIESKIESENQIEPELVAEPETVEYVQNQLQEKRNLLFDIEKDMVSYRDSNLTLMKQVSQVKQRMEKIYAQLEEEKSTMLLLVEQCETNQEQIIDGGTFIKQIKSEIRQLEKKLLDMSTISVSCCGCTVEGAVEETQFEVSPEDLKARLFTILDEQFISEASISDAKAIAGYIVLAEVVKKFSGKEVKMFFPEEKSTLAKCLSQHFNIETNIV